jgi:signal transduction histidine kinase
LQTRDVDEAKRREFYDVMLADTDRLLGTVEQVLRAGHAGQKRRRLARQRVDVHAIVNECVALARTRYPMLDPEALRIVNSSGRLAQFDRTVEAETSVLVVMGDADDLRAAVSNLIDNAIKYSLERVRVTVEVGSTDSQRAVVRVRDEGLGIPAGQLKSIFKRFYRVPLPVMMRVKGTGLGLFIVRHIVERHGGRVYAESAGENRGSTFTILLPLAEAAAAIEHPEPKTA